MEIILSMCSNQNQQKSPIMNFVSNRSHLKGQASTLLDSLMQHMIYTNEQGLKIQISEFFKYLFDNEVTLSQVQIRCILYEEIIKKIADFFEKFASDYDGKVFTSEVEYTLYKKFEHSIYLMLDILNRVIVEHKYQFRTQCMNKL